MRAAGAVWARGGSRRASWVREASCGSRAITQVCLHPLHPLHRTWCSARCRSAGRLHPWAPAPAPVTPCPPLHRLAAPLPAPPCTFVCPFSSSVFFTGIFCPISSENLKMFPPPLHPACTSCTEQSILFCTPCTTPLRAIIRAGSGGDSTDSEGLRAAELSQRQGWWKQRG